MSLSSPAEPRDTVPAARKRADLLPWAALALSALALLGVIGWPWWLSVALLSGIPALVTVVLAVAALLVGSRPRWPAIGGLVVGTIAGLLAAGLVVLAAAAFPASV